MHFFKTFLIAFLFLFAVSACQKPIEMTSDLYPGQYKIVMLDIQPSSTELANNPEYWAMKKLIQANLQKELPYLGHSPNVGMKISVIHVNTSINVAKAMLIGDNYKLSAFIQLWDLNTKQQLGFTRVTVTGQHVGGIGGLAGYGIVNGTMDLDQRLANDFVKQLIKKLYPKTK